MKKYDTEAYEFVNRAVAFSIERIGEKRHLSALELLHGCRDLAQREYGFLAPAVFEQWGVNRASDIGSIVYQLIEKRILSASKDDDIQQFMVDFPLFDAGVGNAGKVDKKDKIIIA